MSSHCPSPIYLVAGRDSSRGRCDPMFEAVFAATDIPAPTVAYIGAASGDEPSFFDMIANRLRDSGAGDVMLAPTAHVHHHDGARTRHILEAADLVFVSGGDVEAGMGVLEATGLTAFLRGLYASGKPFFGVSAGSIMLAREWVRWSDPDDDGSATRFECLGLAPVVCDTHGEEDGWEELHALLALSPDRAVGYGIPSGGAIRVAPDGAVTALGIPTHVFARHQGRVVRQADLAVERGIE